MLNFSTSSLDKTQVEQLEALASEQLDEISDAISGLGDVELFYTKAGYFVRILRGPGIIQNRYCIIQIFEPNGKLLTQYAKGLESNTMFSLRLPHELRGPLVRLQKSPNFFPARNDQFQDHVVLSRTPLERLTIKNEIVPQI